MRVPIWLPLRRGSDAISPTAHYTGHVWGRHGLSHPQLATLEGRLLFDALTPATIASRALGGPTLEGMLLARHRVIDRLLTDAIAGGRVSQVIEIGCGMSPRGWRFTQRHNKDLTYVEADLPDMAERKRRALARMGAPPGRHRVADLDALRDSGPESLAELAATLDPQRGLAIVTEGLLSYFGDEEVLGMWRRFARALAGFSAGLYLADLHLDDEQRGLIDRSFETVLGSFVGRRVHAHFDGEAAGVAALRAAGFADARLHRADRHAAAGDAARDPAARRVHIVEATA
jgi:O-methyltransferase involved in polyketide biosynthesis